MVEKASFGRYWPIPLSLLTAILVYFYSFTYGINFILFNRVLEYN